jgi:hypothetical protein
MIEILKQIDDVFDLTSRERFSEEDAKRAIVKLALALKMAVNIFMAEEGDRR